MEKLMQKKLIIFILLNILIYNLYSEKLGLVLGGGGARGFAHIGVLKVLEEEGLEFDYITGTSMGSIMGGLYSIGYRASDLEEMATTTNWNELFGDVISLERISMEEKDDWKRFIGEFPIKDWKIGLPKGLIAGQNLSTLLTNLTLPVHHVSDFSELPIPFLCIATDTETGQAVVLDKGFLPDCIRASVSIPSIFAPVELNGKLLVDGGLIRNLPAEDLFRMGADKVLAIDVGSTLMKKDKLNSLVAIMNQVVNYRGIESTLEQRKLCDFLVIPDLGDYHAASFDAVRELIDLGEKAAREHIDEIRAFKASLELEEKQKVSFIQKIDKFYVKDIHVTGIKDVSKNLIIGKLRISEESWCSQEEIIAGIERLYGSQYFERVTYQLLPTSGGVDISINVVEKDTATLGFALHYDTDTKASFLLNSTVRNKPFEGAKFSTDLKLSEYPGFRTSYFYHTGWKPGFGILTNFLYDQISIKTIENEKQTDSFRTHTTEADFSLQTLYMDRACLGSGLRIRRTEIEPDIFNFDFKYTNNSFSHFTYFKVNTLDKRLYPTEGTLVSITYERVFDQNTDTEIEDANLSTISKTQTLTIRNEKNIKLTDNLTMRENIYLGVTLQGYSPFDNTYFVGGLPNNTYEKFFPFYGYHFVEESRKNIFVFQSELQVKLPKNLYLRFMGNIGTWQNKTEDIFENPAQKSGGGISLGALTPFGPIDLYFLHAKGRKEPLGYVNIGYSW
jgi:NTE family protein